ncbi:sugar phosphate isomerase/epimerase family protein, partial [Christiangramia aquimixticola]|uniref:sugar phosphate isomerase/epimerase family protein n=1 Tax=Christiangramia aquimixticola TaxID=1697558 RepID=UPI003AA8C841
MNRKIFRAFSLLLVISFTLSFTSCKENTGNQESNIEAEASNKEKDSLFFEISLAQWSLHKLIYDGELDAMDFAKKANSMGFTGIEYVTGFYAERINNAKDPQKEMQIVLDSLKSKSERYNVENLLLMIDGEGDLAVTDSVARNTAVENHKKWIDAAAYLGCHSIRVNLFGSDNREEWKNSSVDALSKLAKYAADKNVNVLVENHGYLSSDADLLVNVMKEVNMENCG